MSQFKVGDVVELKSGGGPMTIVTINGDKATCEWRGCEKGEFNLTSLVIFKMMVPFSL